MPDLESYYRARADEYDRVYAKPERQEDLRGLQRWASSVMAHQTVLELAAGTGYWTAAYAERATAVTATDINKATLAIARGRREWPASVRFAEADAFELDRVHGLYDAAFIGFFWSHLELDRLNQFLAGLADRLEPGSTVAFLDNRYVEGNSTPIERTDAFGNTYQLRHLDDGSTWEVLKNFPTPIQLREYLAPFVSEIEVQELTYYWTVACVFK